MLMDGLALAATKPEKRPMDTGQHLPSQPSRRDESPTTATDYHESTRLVYSPGDSP